MHSPAIKLQQSIYSSHSFFLDYILCFCLFTRMSMNLNGFADPIFTSCSFTCFSTISHCIYMGGARAPDPRNTRTRSQFLRDWKNRSLDYFEKSREDLEKMLNRPGFSTLCWSFERNYWKSMSNLRVSKHKLKHQNFLFSFSRLSFSYFFPLLQRWGWLTFFYSIFRLSSWPLECTIGTLNAGEKITWLSRATMIHL